MNPDDQFTWSAQIFADGELELGFDTNEIDLETLVLKHWAERAQESLNDRLERAVAARARWTEATKQGYHCVSLFSD